MTFYYKITNADGKQWVMPSHNMSVGMLLYQPIAWKGRMLKRWYPLVSKMDVFGVVRKALHIEKCACPLSKVLVNKLQDIFASRQIEFSVFNGTPCAHQKVTVQIYHKKKILGYCKITNKPDLITIFQREEDYLNWLQSHGVKGVPQCLCCQKMQDGNWIFVQTTTKTMKAEIHHKLGDLELSFLEMLASKTRTEIDFKQTDMFKWLNILERNGGCNSREVVKAIHCIYNYYNQKKIVTFSAYHSDFTPWNMFSEGDELFVFDWEYACKSYMPYFDLIHYLVQTAIFESRADSVALYDVLFVKNATILKKYFENPSIAVLAYLLDILAKYGTRDEGHETDETRKVKEKRIELVTLILERCEMKRE